MKEVVVELGEEFESFHFLCSVIIFLGMKCGGWGASFPGSLFFEAEEGDKKVIE